METVKIYVKGSDITKIEAPGLTVGMVGVAYEVLYDAAWDALSKVVIFRAGRNTLIALDGKVPPVLLTQAQTMLQVGIEGRNQKGDLVIPTIWGDVGYVIAGADVGDASNVDPDNPAWAQSAAIAQQALQKAQQALDTVEDNQPLTERAEAAAKSTEEAVVRANNVEKAAAIVRDQALTAREEAVRARTAAEAAAVTATESEQVIYGTVQKTAENAEKAAASAAQCVQSAYDAERASTAAAQAEGNASATQVYMTRAETAAKDAKAASSEAENSYMQAQQAGNTAQEKAQQTIQYAASASESADRAKTEADKAVAASQKLTAEKFPVRIPAGLPDTTPATVQGVLDALHEDTSLGMTGVSVGDCIRVKSVDENGRPVDWESVSYPQKWELIEEIVTQEDVSSLTRAALPNGEKYNFRKLSVILCCDSVNANTDLKCTVNFDSYIGGYATARAGESLQWAVEVDVSLGVFQAINMSANNRYTPARVEANNPAYSDAEEICRQIHISATEGVIPRNTRIIIKGIWK